MADIYLSPTQAASMTWEEYLEALEVQEWDWREEFIATHDEPTTIIRSGRRDTADTVVLLTKEEAINW